MKRSVLIVLFTLASLPANAGISSLGHTLALSTVGAVESTDETAQKLADSVNTAGKQFRIDHKAELEKLFSEGSTQICMRYKRMSKKGTLPLLQEEFSAGVMAILDGADVKFSEAKKIRDHKVVKGLCLTVELNGPIPDNKKQPTPTYGQYYRRVYGKEFVNLHLNNEVNFCTDDDQGLTYADKQKSASDKWFKVAQYLADGQAIVFPVKEFTPKKLDSRSVQICGLIQLKKSQFDLNAPAVAAK